MFEEETTATVDTTAADSAISESTSTSSGVTDSTRQQDVSIGEEDLGGAERQQADKAGEQQQDANDPDTTDYRGSVSRRIRGMVKDAPELGQIFKNHPKLQEEIEARFRRDIAFREIFPNGVAEARTLRDELPNGVEDLRALQDEIKTFKETDDNFYNADRDGNYPGHAHIIENLYKDDRQAAVALFKTFPKEWHKLDPESYNEVMGQIVGATFMQRDIPGFVEEMLESVEDQASPLAKNLSKLLNWMKGFTQEKPRPTAEEERLTRERKEFDSRRAKDDERSTQEFSRSFVSESKRLQNSLIAQHPAIKKVLAAQNLDKAKKDGIVEQVRASVEKFLGRSPSFMSKLKPVYDQRNLNEALSVQRAAWSQQWLMNRFVRSVLNKEVPQLVAANREAARRAGAPVKKNTTTGDGKQQQQRPTKPFQRDGRWYHPDGRKMSTTEVLSGKYEAA